MKLLVFGSMNIDHVYQVEHFVREGETLSSLRYARNAGGKGFNQAVALAKAGQEVFFSGAMGADGAFLREQLEKLRVHTGDLRQLDAPTGHAMIQVDAQGRNSILLYGGANQRITPQMIDETLDHFAPGDWLLMQNEISCGADLLRKAGEKGLRVALNPSPVSRSLRDWPLEAVALFLLNEIEGGDLTGCTRPEDMLDALLRRFPRSRIVLTLGSEGSIYADASQRLHQGIVPVQAVDTTAAGDSFTGYFLHALLRGDGPAAALNRAAKAAAITVSRPGAGEAIPFAEEVDSF